ncbi:hypothetical protein VM1G_04606 [Cytospora mali]|uniref:37S ribosomal protein mrp21, mitochondrial n=1 Tax=Cytospora mali TaxID=578113 RepID=A0A194VWW5_CYTMA|nr:hypothetical protein VM1G_04606 [Valsa mali]
MELRPIQTALLAGRAASRWTTSYSTSPMLPSFQRHFSTTMPIRSEAEAPAPAARSVAALRHRIEQQKQQQQQQQQQPQSPRQSGSSSTSNMYSSFLSQNSSTPSSTTGSTGTGTGNFADPWAQPNRARRPSTSPALRNRNTNQVIEDLGIFNELSNAPRPAADDFAAAHQHKKESVMDIKLRLRPSIGRTVHCGKGSRVDLARGLQMLNVQVRRNKVSQDLMRQRFHERPGLKRKRLRRERWRARFKDGFKATCGRVRELARQGW